MCTVHVIHCVSVIWLRFPEVTLKQDARPLITTDSFVSISHDSLLLFSCPLRLAGFTTLHVRLCQRWQIYVHMCVFTGKCGSETAKEDKTRGHSYHLQVHSHTTQVEEDGEGNNTFHITNLNTTYAITQQHHCVFTPREMCFLFCVRCSSKVLL